MFGWKAFAQSRDCEARIGPASAIGAIRARCFLSQHCGLVPAWMGNLGASDSPGMAMLACFSARQSPKPAQSIGIFFHTFVEVARVGTLLAHLPALDVVFVSFLPSRSCRCVGSFRLSLLVPSRLLTAGATTTNLACFLPFLTYLSSQIRKSSLLPCATRRKEGRSVAVRGSSREGTTENLGRYD